MLYNFVAAVLLAYAGVGSGLRGAGLWLAVLLHVALAVWCLASLRINRIKWVNAVAESRQRKISEKTQP